MQRIMECERASEVADGQMCVYGFRRIAEIIIIASLSSSASYCGRSVIPMRLIFRNDFLFLI